MSNSNNRIIDSRTHGLARTFLVRTRRGSSPAQPITCFASYKVNNRPLIDSDVEISDGDRQAIKSYFTYSRNGGPIQRVMIDDDADDWAAVEALYAKIDTDLCRAQDGESLAFYILSYDIGLTEQVIPDLNDIDLPPDIIPPIELNRMTMASVPEQPDYDYTITGISGDGLIPIPNAFNIDSRNISIPHPYSAIDSETVEWSAWPRWYPNNTIVKEDNTIVIYPSEGIEPHDFDLFKVLGGVGNTPITINSCVKVVPRKYSCEASYAVGSQVSSLILGRLPLAESGVQSTAYREPVMFSESPFPFKAAGRHGDQNTWPPLMNDESSTRGADWIASYRRNDGPLKVITWNTGSRNSGSHHSVWDAIKELLLDDYGRTAFMLSNFNSTASSFNGDGDVTVKSGIRSNLNFTIRPSEEGELLHRSTQPYRQSGKSVEVRDRQIQFSDENAGTVWNENTITIYPTPYSVANEYGFDGHSDYYEYLCQYYDQLEAGEPITIHSCAAVEPVDHIQVNTGFKIDRSAMGEVMPPGLIARVQINDGEIKEFANEAEFVEKTIYDLFSYVSLLGAEPIVTSSSGVNNDGDAQSKTNLLYFRADVFSGGSAIVGCSGIERPDDSRMELKTIDMESQKMETLKVEILDDMDSDIPHVRTSNKITFHKTVRSGYVDYFDFIVGAKGNTHTIYSSAGVPCLLIGGPVEGDGDGDGDGDGGDGEGGPVIDPNATQFAFRTANNASQNSELRVKVNVMAAGTPWSLVDTDSDVVIADETTHSPKYDGSVDFYLNAPGANVRNYNLRGSANKVGVIIESETTTAGNIDVLSFSDSVSEYSYAVKNAAITVPSVLPKHITVTDGMFTGCTNIVQDISEWDVSHVTSMVDMFSGCTNFNQDISGWDVSNVTDMTGMLRGCTNFNQPIGNWNIGNATLLTRMMQDATNFNQDLSGWQVTQVVSLREFLSGCSAFNQDISGWDVSNVTDMQYLFYNASAFDQDLSGWNTISVNNLVATFRGASSFNTDISTWNTSNVTNLTSTFQDATAFNQPLNDWDVSQVTTMQSTFNGAVSFDQPLDSWNVSNVGGSFPMYGMFNNAILFNQDLSSWCVPDVEYVTKFDEGATSWSEPRPPWGFCGLEVVNNLEFTITTGNVALDNDRLTIGFPEGMPGTFKILKDGVLTNTSPDGYDSDIMNQYGQIAIYVPPNTTRTFTLQASAPVAQLKYYTDDTQSTNKIAIDAFSDNILRYEFSIKNADLTVPQTLPVHITSMFAMFNGSNRFNQDLSGWDVSRITNATDAFRDCVAFNGNVGTWRLDKLGNAQRMFKGCKVFNQPLNNWRFPELRVATEMFSGCSALNQDLNSWNVSGIRNFEGMFSGCTAFNGTIADWNMTGASVLNKMFYNCRAFNQPIGNWNVASVSNFDGMFSYAISFNQDISTWDMSGVKNVNGLANMFAQAIGFNQDLSTWNVLKVPSRPYEFDSGLTTTWTLPRPKWGTDGKPIIVPPIVPYDSNSFNVLIEQTETQSPTNVDITLTLNPDARDWEVWIGNEMIASPYYAKAPVTVSNKSITIPNNNNRTQIAVKGSMSTVTLLMASPLTYTSLDKITTNVINYSPTINSYRFTVKESALTVPDTLPSHITSLSEMFKECTNILSDISGWDTSNILYATRMLNGAINFNQDLSGWNVLNILTKPASFDDYCNSWTLPRPIWGTTGVVATPLTIEIDNRAYTEIKTFVVKVPRLQEPVVKINDDVVYANGVVASGSSMNIVGNVRILYLGVPPSAVSTFVVGGTLDHFDISTNAGTNESTIFNVLNFSDTISGYTFSVKGSLLTVPQELSPVITSTYEMFHECKNFNQDIGDWDVSNVVNMDRMFRWAINFNQDLSRWNVTRFVSEPEHFSFAVPNWTLPKPVWGTNGTPSDLPWSVTDTTVDQDVVDVNATKRINGVAYKSNIKYTPSNVAIKEAIANEDSTLLVTNVLNKLIGNVSNWTLDLNNNRIVYN